MLFSTSLQSVTTVTNHKPKTSSEESEAVSVQEQGGIISSFELAAQSSKGNQATAGTEKSLKHNLYSIYVKLYFILITSFDALKPL